MPCRRKGSKQRSGTIIQLLRRNEINKKIKLKVHIYHELLLESQNFSCPENFRILRDRLWNTLLDQLTSSRTSRTGGEEATIFQLVVVVVVE